MSFLPAITGWVREAPGPRATLHTSVSGRDGDRHRLTFALTRELVDEAGWQGGERFVVSIGVGEDLGAFQISRADRPRTGVKLIPNSRARGFRLSLNLPPVIHGVVIADLVGNLPRPCPLAWVAHDAVLVLRAEVKSEAQSSSVVPLRGVGMVGASS